MNKVTISKNEYERLKQHSIAYLRIAREVTESEDMYDYDMAYINRLTEQALKDHAHGKSVKARSIDEALTLIKHK
ncbi:MAG: hypothetical protein Q8L47_05475 [bacterium]|nr:hypothetical protein [bacterium]